MRQCARSAASTAHRVRAPSAPRPTRSVLYRPAQTLFSQQQRTFQTTHPHRGGPGSGRWSTETTRFTHKELANNRLWTSVAGIDPREDRVQTDLWHDYTIIARDAYFTAGFDIALAWMRQDAGKKEQARAQIKENVGKDVRLKEYEGLVHDDLISYKLMRVHYGYRDYMATLAGKKGRLTSTGSFPKEVVEAVREGRIRVHKQRYPALGGSKG